MSGPGTGGPAPGYKWRDAEPGNRLAEVHGAWSERRVAPLAERFKRELLDGPDCPPYLLADTSYGPVVDQWAWQRGRVALLREFVDECGFITALADHEEHQEHEERTKSTTTRSGRSKRVRSAVDELHRAETLLANLSTRLGLDPAGRARIGRDLSQARWFGGPRPLDQALAQIRADRERQALEGGGGGDQ